MSERDLQRLLALWEKTIGTGWLEVADWLRSLPANSTDAIERRLMRGDIGGLIAESEAAALKLAAESHAAFTGAGQRGAKWLDGEVKNKLIRFDASGSRVVQVARRNQLELVHGFEQERWQIAQQITHDAMVDGTAKNPRMVAQAFRDSIGLAPHQERAVRNYRRALEQQDWSKALGYELSSGHADRTIRRVQHDGGGLTQAQVDSMTEKYRQNQITSRAENIARTEASKNVHQGLRESFQQAVDRGDVKAEHLVREWLPGPPTENAREEHRASSLLDQRPKFGEPYLMPDGSHMMHPGDPAGGAKNTNHCRCTEATTLDAAAVQHEEPAADPAADSSTPSAPPKNPKRVAAARIAAEASAERRREIHSAAKANLPQELHSTWDKEGHKFMREEAGRIRGVKDRVNASSTLSQAFAEKYGSGGETVFGNEGDRFHVRAEIEAAHAESWADEQERKYYAAAQEAALRGEVGEDLTFTPANASDDDPPF